MTKLENEYKDASLKPAPADQVYNKGRLAPANADKVALAQDFAQDEERLLRAIDRISAQTFHVQNADGTRAAPDHRWIAIARTHFQEGFMALNRAVFQPQRIKLPEDGE